MRVFVAYTRENASLATELQESLRSRGFLVSEGFAYGRRHFLHQSFAEPSVAKALSESDALVVLGFGRALPHLFHEIGFFAANSRLERTIVLGREQDFNCAPPWISAAHKILVRSRVRELFAPGNYDDILNDICRRLKAVPSRAGYSRDRGVFLSYSRNDSEKARQVYGILTSIGCSVWFAEESLLPGQDWNREIQYAIRSASLFMALLSSEGLSRRGFFQKELRFARDVIDEIPEGDIFILPVLLDSGAEEFLPDWLRRFHWTSWETDHMSEELRAAISVSQDLGGQWNPYRGR